jgi:hypothetical protein
MALSSYQGPPTHTSLFRSLVGEKIKACFIDSQGHVWMMVESGHAIVWAGFDTMAPAFRIEAPDQVHQEMSRRRADLQTRIQDIKDLAPGVDL